MNISIFFEKHQKLLIVLLAISVFTLASGANAAALCWHKTYKVQHCAGNSGNSAVPVSYIDTQCVPQCDDIWGDLSGINYQNYIEISPPTVLLDAIDDGHFLGNVELSAYATELENNFNDSIFVEQKIQVKSTASIYDFRNRQYSFLRSEISSYESVASSLPAPSDKIFLYLAKLNQAPSTKMDDLVHDLTSVEYFDHDDNPSTADITLPSAERVCFMKCASESSSYQNKPVIPIYKNLTSTAAIEQCYSECTIASYCENNCSASTDGKKDCFSESDNVSEGYCKKMVEQRRLSPDTTTFDCSDSCTKNRTTEMRDEYYNEECSSYWKPKIKLQAKTGAGGCTTVNILGAEIPLQIRDTDENTFTLDWGGGDDVSSPMIAAPWGDPLPRTYYAALYKGHICVFDLGMKFFLADQAPTQIKGITQQGNKGIVRPNITNDDLGELPVAAVPHNGLLGSEESIGEYQQSVCYKMPLAEGPKPCCLKLKKELSLPNVLNLAENQKHLIPSYSIQPTEYSTFLHPRIRMEFDIRNYSGYDPDNPSVHSLINHKYDFGWEYFDVTTGEMISNSGRAVGNRCKTLEDPSGNDRKFCVQMLADKIHTSICVIEERDLGGGAISDVLVGCHPRNNSMPEEEVVFGVTISENGSTGVYDLNGNGSLDVENLPITNSYVDPKIRFFAKLKFGSNVFIHSFLFDHLDNKTIFGANFSAAPAYVTTELAGGEQYNYEAICIKGVHDSAGSPIDPTEKSISYFINEPDSVDYDTSSGEGPDLCVRKPVMPCGYKTGGVRSGDPLVIGSGNNAITAYTHAEWPVIHIPDGSLSAYGHAEPATAYADTFTNTNPVRSGSYHPIDNHLTYKYDPQGYALYCPPGYQPKNGTDVTKWNNEEILRLKCVIDIETNIASYRLADSSSSAVSDITCVPRNSCPAINTYCSTIDCQPGDVAAPIYEPYNMTNLGEELLHVTDPAQHTAWGKSVPASNHALNQTVSNGEFTTCLDARYKTGSQDPQWVCNEFGIWDRAVNIQNSCVKRGCLFSSAQTISERSQPSIDGGIGLNVGSCKPGYGLLHSADGDDYTQGNYVGGGATKNPPKWLCLPDNGSPDGGSWYINPLTYTYNSNPYLFEDEMLHCQEKCSEKTSNGATWHEANPGEIVEGICADGVTPSGSFRQCGGTNPNNPSSSIQLSRTIQNSFSLIPEGTWSTYSQPPSLGCP